jgi:hypothetical protein
MIGRSGTRRLAAREIYGGEVDHFRAPDRPGSRFRPRRNNLTEGGVKESPASGFRGGARSEPSAGGEIAWLEYHFALGEAGAPWQPSILRYRQAGEPQARPSLLRLALLRLVTPPNTCRGDHGHDQKCRAKHAVRRCFEKMACLGLHGQKKRRRDEHVKNGKEEQDAQTGTSLHYRHRLNVRTSSKP